MVLGSKGSWISLNLFFLRFKSVLEIILVYHQQCSVQVCDFFVTLLPTRKTKKSWFQVVDVQKAHPQFVTMPVLNGCIWRFFSRINQRRFFRRINQQPSALRVAHHDVLLLDKSAEMDGWMMDDFMADFCWRSSVDWSLASLRRSLWQPLGLI